MMASPPKGSPEETARLLSPEMISTPPQSMGPPPAPDQVDNDPFRPRAFQDSPPSVSVTTVLRVLTACLALTSFIIIMIVLPDDRYRYRNNKGYVPSAVFDMLAFVWQAVLVLVNLRKLRVVIELGDREFNLCGGKRRGRALAGGDYNLNNPGQDKKSKRRIHHLISLVDLALFIGLLPSWIVMLTRRHDIGAAAVDALVLILEGYLVLSQIIPVLRRLVITLKEDDYAYQINLPSAQV